MPRCDLLTHVKACQEMYRRAAGRPGHPCNGCKTGRARTEDVTNPPSGDTKPAVPETIPPKKEAVVATKGKEAILRRIENEKICNRGRLTCFCSVTAAELDAAVKELETEGKIKSWEKKRGCLYTLPGAPDPRIGNPPTLSNDATIPSKRQRIVNRRQTDASIPSSPPIKSRAKKERPMPAPHRFESNGNAVAAAIAEIEARRAVALDQVARFDNALEQLRALS